MSLMVFYFHSQEVLHEFDGLLWVDASIRFKYHNFTKYVNHIVNSKGEKYNSAFLDDNPLKHYSGFSSTFSVYSKLETNCINDRGLAISRGINSSMQLLCFGVSDYIGDITS